MMGIKEAMERWDSLLNGGVENRKNLLDMSKAFHRSGKACLNYQKSLMMYDRHRKCARMADLMVLDGMCFCGLSDLESALGV